jgi:hypothetical protein
MSFEFFPGVGVVHLQTVKPARRAPAGTLHKWSGAAVRGGKPVTCLKCGCKKAYLRDYRTQYLMPGGHQLTEERPACPGTPSTQTATATPTNG